jgi:hypothetical protein
MKLDEDKIDDAVLALLFLSSAGEGEHGKASIGTRSGGCTKRVTSAIR